MNGTLDSASSYNLIGPSWQSVVSDNVQGNNFLSSLESAGLTSLGGYGGPTQTHALKSTSLAIDAGSNEIVDEFFGDFDVEFIDQRRLARIVDWDGLGGALVDIGAVELVFSETHS